MSSVQKIKELFRDMLATGEPRLPVAPFGTVPHAPRETYLHLYEAARSVTYPEIDAFEARQGFAIERDWVDRLARHTQIVIKTSKLNYQHGRLLYSALRRYLSGGDRRHGHYLVLETGTGRGFSALCMAKAMIDSDASGHVVTVDVLPHNTPMIWNCIDDHDGLKTRHELLSRWPHELGRVIFIQGRTKTQIPRIGLSRVHFAFLDAQHTTEDVIGEYVYVRTHQQIGDMIFFDDVTPGLFDGVVEAVKEIEKEGRYAVERLRVTDERGYAIAIRVA